MGRLVVVSRLPDTDRMSGNGGRLTRSPQAPQPLNEELSKNSRNLSPLRKRLPQFLKGTLTCFGPNVCSTLRAFST